VGSQDRRSPRYSRQVAVDINGLEIVTTNVAAGGVQLCCPEMRFRGMQQAVKDGRLSVKLRIPGSKKWVNIVGTTRYSNLTDDEYLVGFQFNAFTADDESLWTAYIDTLSNAKPIE
jgi:hypothetical protein